MAKLEIIAFTKNDISKINNSNADRIELVENLEKGGLTPSLELIEYSKKNSTKPLRIMIRPHDNSFVYDDNTIKLMLKQIENVKNIGCEGVVFGVLTNDKKLDFHNMKKLILASKPMKITCHRAIDDIPTEFLKETLKQLEELEIDTILTSLGHIEEEKITRYNILKDSKIEIMYGSGLNLDNIDEISNLYPLPFYHMGTAVRENNSLTKEIVEDKINMASSILKK